MTIAGKLTIAAWAASAALCTPAAGAPPAPGVNPGDDAMTCEQIAAELAPYAQQMQPNLQAFATSQQQLYARGRERGEGSMGCDSRGVGPVGRRRAYFRGPNHLRACTTRSPIDPARCRLLLLVRTHAF